MNNPNMEKLSELYKLANMAWMKAWEVATQASAMKIEADDVVLKSRMVLNGIMELIDEEEKKTKKKKNV